jgi:acetoin utilization deacetylase AcuC-like enzyme
MRVLYHSKADLDLSLYGIQIPLKGNRSQKVFSYISTHYSVAELEKVPKKISIQDLKRVHREEYIDELFSDYHQKYFYHCYELLDREGRFNRYDPSAAQYSFDHAREIIKDQIDLTYLGLEEAIRFKSSMTLHGGMHHAMSDRPRGFCLLHDGLVALAKLIDEKKIAKAWIVDVDAHKGDGAPEILARSPFKDQIKTMSIHMADAWPLNESPLDSNGNLKPWFIPSDLDIEHYKGEEKDYLNKLSSGLLEMEKKFGLPEVVWIVLGADPYEHDELASTQSLKLSRDEMLKRDELLFSFFSARNIPQAYVMGGGYGDESWKMYAQFLEMIGHTEELH